uniref:OSJNBa0073E02.11 protein n=2 Tax=Oryza sativa subsp. japonica TaxID=39947 RepID=Q7XKV8_ORYSJ|nr:OSJNBa0073E02.11 [Oryza sativa Japonica Group]
MAYTSNAAYRKGAISKGTCGRLILEKTASAKHTIATAAVPSPQCQSRCGDVDIQYPFGIGANCSLAELFNVECKVQHGISKPFIGNVEVLNISLSRSTLRVLNGISTFCYNASGLMGGVHFRFNAKNTPFRFSDVYNKFTVIGCNTLAYIADDGGTGYQSGCFSQCRDLSGLVDGSCSGMGCCQTTIPRGMYYYNVTFDKRFNTSQISRFGRCSYAVLMEAASFNFSTTYINTTKFNGTNGGRVPMVIDWAIREKSCDIAKQNMTSYACLSSNSECVASTNGPGYVCNCSHGYEGNPYLPDPHGCHGVIIGFIVLMIIAFCGQLVIQRRKLTKIKKEYFRQHGGMILFESMKSKKGLAFTVFTEAELIHATNNFDKSRIIGQGGHGTVYKGTVKDNMLVAIKRCALVDERQKKEFGQEMLILSPINHKNIIKLLGCCLEVEVPMLVYEFVPNGTLFELIHGKNQGLQISFSTLLRIAHEAAEGLHFLHSYASPPILHGDVKTANILLDENYMAKVTDFGASILAPSDKEQFVTMVQGTCGYLDPEYMQTCQLTDKSDVYSFGVILLEILTGQVPLKLEGPAIQRSLSSVFLSAMKGNNLDSVLVSDIKGQESMELIGGLAELAKQCLDMCGANRPSMKEITDELGRLRKLSLHPWVQVDAEMAPENLLGGPSTINSGLEIETSSTGYLGEERENLPMNPGSTYYAR